MDTSNTTSFGLAVCSEGTLVSLVLESSFFTNVNV